MKKKKVEYRENRPRKWKLGKGRNENPETRILRSRIARAIGNCRRHLR